ncbi:hypothetical protein JAAARDRAFT_66814 [Jaapia argillacea MUCL 33604]|uniref:RED-like N-terminal domain-containing protein n=1 Tax=Jaapia argillacea MUCL 33604 TaxID=933084 RepID=A0A067QE11_9AGAM|nr:hypothetical protein JAAARDRAFT_66814 [Jaapia argillacea MUCL 33604]
MDQDSFRQLLHSKPGGSSSSGQTPSSRPRGSLLAAASKPKPKTEPAQPAFKPRKVNKSSKYRDRATERRQGTGNDFAQVEALLEDFERQNADIEDKEAIEEKRQYLGGDSTHSILVKGLDYALLEQNKAKEAAVSSVADDLSLEQAFLDSASSAKVGGEGKKRTRDEIVGELKKRRKGLEGDLDLDLDLDAKRRKVEQEEEERVEEEKRKSLAATGKFKPIGFKPITSSTTDKPKNKKGKEPQDGEKKKRKKKKVVPEVGSGPSVATESKPVGKLEDKPQQPTSSTSPPQPTQPPAPRQPPIQEPQEPLEEDFDIFAGAGDYTGIDLGSDSDSDPERPSAPSKHPTQPHPESEPETTLPKKANWFGSPAHSPSPPPLASTILKAVASGSGTKPEDGEVEGEEEGEMRLVPLSSSAIPSIKEFLAMEQEEEKKEKRRAKKEKKKKSGKKGDESD